MSAKGTSGDITGADPELEWEDEDWESRVELCRGRLATANDPEARYHYSVGLVYALIGRSVYDQSDRGFAEAVSLCRALLKGETPKSERWTNLNRHIALANIQWLSSASNEQEMLKRLRDIVRYGEAALSGRTDDRALWASTATQVAHSLTQLRELETHKARQHTEHAKRRFLDALTVFSKEDYPGEHEEVMAAMQLLKKDRLL